jgi:hypothetical protein
LRGQLRNCFAAAAKRTEFPLGAANAAGTPELHAFNAAAMTVSIVAMQVRRMCGNIHTLQRLGITPQRAANSRGISATASAAALGTGAAFDQLPLCVC